MEVVLKPRTFFDVTSSDLTNCSLVLPTLILFSGENSYLGCQKPLLYVNGVSKKEFVAQEANFHKQNYKFQYTVLKLHKSFRLLLLQPCSQ